MSSKRLNPRSNLNLDKYNVFVVDDYRKPQYFDVRNDFKDLSYGNNYLSIAAIDNVSADYTLKLSSHVQIEVKDSRGNIIFHDLVYNVSFSYFASFYIKIYTTISFLENFKFIQIIYSWINYTTIKFWWKCF